MAVVYNGKSELSRRRAREYARVRGVPEGNLVSLDCPMTGEISRKEYEETIRVPDVYKRQVQGSLPGGDSL